MYKIFYIASRGRIRPGQLYLLSTWTGLVWVVTFHCVTSSYLLPELTPGLTLCSVPLTGNMILTEIVPGDCAL